MSLIQTKTAIVQLPGRSVCIRELTVSEIRVWLDNIGHATDLVDVELLDGCSLKDVLVLTDLTESEVEGLTPSQLQAVIDAAKEVNARFFMMRERITAEFLKILSNQEQSSAGLSGL